MSNPNGQAMHEDQLRFCSPLRLHQQQTDVILKSSGGVAVWGEGSDYAVYGRLHFQIMIPGSLSPLSPALNLIWNLRLDAIAQKQSSHNLVTSLCGACCVFVSFFLWLTEVVWHGGRTTDSLLTRPQRLSIRKLCHSNRHKYYNKKHWKFGLEWWWIRILYTHIINGRKLR